MEKLFDAITDLVSNTPPDKISQFAERLRSFGGPHASGDLKKWAQTAAAKGCLDRLIGCWKELDLPSLELAGMLLGASYAYHAAKSEQDIELVWTGPSSELIATRKTEQALLEVINVAKNKLFLTSFVAYDVASIVVSLASAADRGVNLSMLLESSDKHGGGVSIDAIARMREVLPTTKVYFWGNKGDSFAGGKVHAKVAVCDEELCFISSANLTGHAMEKNMEAGVLIRGGALPRTMQNHLEALVTIKIVQA